MTPEAVQALHEVATAADGVSARVGALSEALLADQQQARELADKRFKDAKARENRRFQQVNRAIAGLYAGLLLVLILVAVVVVQGIRSDQDRDDRSLLATAQRRCSDTVMADALVRVSIYATRSGTDPAALIRLQEALAAARDNDFVALVRVRDETEKILASIPAANTELREAAQKANDRLLRVRDICYTGMPPEDPLAN
jgi:hypothetical protein